MIHRTISRRSTMDLWLAPLTPRINEMTHHTISRHYTTELHLAPLHQESIKWPITLLADVLPWIYDSLPYTKNQSNDPSHYEQTLILWSSDLAPLTPRINQMTHNTISRSSTTELHLAPLHQESIKWPITLLADVLPWIYDSLPLHQESIKWPITLWADTLPQSYISLPYTKNQSNDPSHYEQTLYHRTTSRSLTPRINQMTHHTMSRHSTTWSYDSQSITPRINQMTHHTISRRSTTELHLALLHQESIKWTIALLAETLYHRATSCSPTPRINQMNHRTISRCSTTEVHHAPLHQESIKWPIALLSDLPQS